MAKKGNLLKICCVSAMLVSSIWAKNIVNGISVLVNNEPITLYEIHKMSKSMNISIDDALKNLIEKRLQDSQIKKLGIKASSFEINQKLDEVAKKNGISTYELLKFIRSKGIGENEYRENIANAIKNEKLFRRIFKKNLPTPSENEIKSFYNANKSSFSKESIFSVTSYKASTYTALQEIQNNPMLAVAGVVINQEDVSTSDIDKKTAYYLNQTPSGKFTPIEKVGNGVYKMYLVGEKKNLSTLSLEKARPIIIRELSKKYEKETIKNYFDKLKAGADIEILREP